MSGPVSGRGGAEPGRKRLTCRFSLKTEKSTAMKKMFVTVACALLSLAAFAQQSVKSDEGKPLVFSKAEFVGNLTVRMIRSDTARIEIKQSQSESNRLDWGVKDGNLFVKLKPGMNGKASSAEVVLYYDSLQALKASAANVAVEGTVCGRGAERRSGGRRHARHGCGYDRPVYESGREFGRRHNRHDEVLYAFRDE